MENLNRGAVKCFSPSLRGSGSELIELIELAHQGICDIAVETFSLDNGAKAYCRRAANT